MGTTVGNREEQHAKAIEQVICLLERLQEDPSTVLRIEIQQELDGDFRYSYGATVRRWNITFTELLEPSQ